MLLLSRYSPSVAIIAIVIVLPAKLKQKINLVILLINFISLQQLLYPAVGH